MEKYEVVRCRDCVHFGLIVGGESCLLIRGLLAPARTTFAATAGGRRRQMRKNDLTREEKRLRTLRRLDIAILIVWALTIAAVVMRWVLGI